MEVFSIEKLQRALKKHFGYDDFRLLQLPIIENVMAGNDTLAVMPTGGGKSICFQLPALLLPGVAVVISPLIALMKDQADALRANGIRAEFLNSSQSMEEQRRVIADLQNGKVKILYIAPERIPADSSAFIEFIAGLQPSLFAIDESHCISQWGHDFRPDYRKLSILKERFPNLPVIALTASADEITRHDIVDKLSLSQPKIFISSFNRANIKYTVIPKRDAIGQIVHYIQQHGDESGIIYALSRASTEMIAAKLNAQGFKAAFYHAGMETKDRSKVQEAFQKDDIKIIAATIAFGMGIDKPNVRYVIHHDVPKNMEGYYQETGRAGRDGLRAEAILLYSAGDIFKLKSFATVEGNDTQTAINLKKLNKMQEYCEAEGCRRQYIMQYFGEPFADYCANCDYCNSALEEKDMTENVQKLLSAVARTGERYGTNYIIDFLRGSASEKIVAAHKELKTYGIGKEVKREDWQWIVSKLLYKRYLEKSDDQYATLKLNNRSWEVLKAGAKVMLVVKKPKAVVEQQESISYNKELLTILKSERKKLADANNVPPYAILSDSTLEELALYYPLAESELLQISGFGDYKVKQIGKVFLKAVRDFTEKYKIESRMSLKKLKKTKKPKSESPATGSVGTNSKTMSLQMFQNGMSLEEIAKERNMAVSTVEGHLAQFIATGEIDILKLMTEEQLDKITEAAQTVNNPNVLKPLKDLLGDEYSYGMIRFALTYLRREG